MTRRWPAFWHMPLITLLVLCSCEMRVLIQSMVYSDQKSIEKWSFSLVHCYLGFYVCFVLHESEQCNQKSTQGTCNWKDEMDMRMHLPYSQPALGHFIATNGNSLHHTQGKGCLNPLAAIGHTFRDVLGGVYTSTNGPMPPTL
jgi:hypothetical protein